MARAKDISNYSVKDFKGIIGKEVTKKNWDFLSDNGNSSKPLDLKETNDICVSHMYKSSSEQFVIDNNSYNLQKRDDQLYVSQDNEETLVESSIICNVRGENEFSETENPKKKKKHQHSKTSATDNPAAMEYCSSEDIESASAECTDDGCKVSEAMECVDVQSTEMSAKKKNRKKIKGKSENSDTFSPDHSTLQGTVISDKKKKKKNKMKENSEDSNTCNTQYRTQINVPSGINIDVKPTNLEGYLCNTKSVSKIHQMESEADEVEGVSRNIVIRFDTSVRTSDKFCNLKRPETEKEGNKHSDGCVTSNDVKNGDSNTLTFISRNNNNYFLRGEEREKIKKHIAENPEILQQVADAFVGSNLMSIKGYGNW